VGKKEGFSYLNYFVKVGKEGGVSCHYTQKPTHTYPHTRETPPSGVTKNSDFRKSRGRDTHRQKKFVHHHCFINFYCLISWWILCFLGVWVCVWEDEELLNYGYTFRYPTAAWEHLQGGGRTTQSSIGFTKAATHSFWVFFLILTLFICPTEATASFAEIYLVASISSSSS